MRAGARSPAQLEGMPGVRRIPRCLTAREDTDGAQSFHLILPRGIGGVTEGQRKSLQSFLDLVDWKGLYAPMGPRVDKRSGCIKPQIRPCTICADPCWQPEGRCKACRGPERAQDTLNWLDHKSRARIPQPHEAPQVSDITEVLIAQVKEWVKDPQQSVISQVQWDIWSWFPGKVIAGMFRFLWQGVDSSSEWEGSHRTGLARRLLGTVIEGLDASLHPQRQKVWRHFLAELAEEGSFATPGDTRTGEARSPSAASWQEESLEHLRQAHAFCLECQTSRPKVCATCRFPSCDWCSALEECPGCAQPIPRVNQEQRSQKGKRSLGATVARNLHNMGRAFVERVID